MAGQQDRTGLLQASGHRGGPPVLGAGPGDDGATSRRPRCASSRWASTERWRTRASGIKRLCADDDRAAQFIWDTTAFGLNYAASVIPEVADDILSIDNANKWGFIHQLGPFEIWDALGVAESVERMEAEGMEVTPWVKEMLAAGHTSFYKIANGELRMYDPASKEYVVIKAILAPSPSRR